MGWSKVRGWWSYGILYEVRLCIPQVQGGLWLLAVTLDVLWWWLAQCV